MMNFTLVPKVLTGYRDAMAIEDAIKHRDAAHLGGQVCAALLFVLGLLKGSRYAHYVDWITPEVATQIGAVLAAGAASLFGWGHFAGGAIVNAAVAGPAGDAPAGKQGSLDAQVGGQPAVAGAADQVRLVSRSSDPAQDDLRGGP
jgi:hypothetical protein